MSHRLSLTKLFLTLVLSSFGCRSKSEAKPGNESRPASPPGDFSRFSDAHYALDYPSDFNVNPTTAGSEEWLSIAPRVPPGVWTDGQGVLQSDPAHPDMLLDDEVDALAKQTRQQGHRIVGGVRRLPTRNGTCKGFVAIDPYDPCPANAPFKTATGNCYAATLSAFCATPASKRLVYAVQLGPVPTADALTPEAAAFGKTHERILSTLEFK